MLSNSLIKSQYKDRADPEGPPLLPPSAPQNLKILRFYNRELLVVVFDLKSADLHTHLNQQALLK